ncbi:MAG: chromosomal replication initiator protein DnaA [Actinomycetota bacterium]
METEWVVTQNVGDLWGRTVTRMRNRLPSPGARPWIEGTRAISWLDDTVVLAAPSAFAKEWLETRYAAELRDSLSAEAGHDLQVRITIDPGSAFESDQISVEPQPARPQPIQSPKATAPVEGPQLNPKYTFETFVTGQSNRFAQAAALAVAEQPARSYNPLFIYAPPGLGKTHLLHAIGHHVRSLYPHALVRYVSSEQFMNEFIQGVREERMPAFRRRFREADVLLVDDIQFMARGEQTQEEFFHTFNALHNDGRQIVITSDRPPNQINPLEDRLRTRFEWGLITDMQAPDLETRVAILQKKAKAEGFEVSDDVLEFLATRVLNNIRELEGRLIRIVSYASLSGQPVTLELANEVLRPLLPLESANDIAVDAIIAETASYFTINKDDLLGPSRSRHLVHARQIAMYLCRELTPLSLPKIGEAFGGRDHTTVMHAQSKIRRWLGEKRPVYAQVQELTARIRQRGTAGISA